MSNDELRNHFAGLAMQARIMRSLGGAVDPDQCWKDADAMLAASGHDIPPLPEPPKPLTEGK